MKKKFSGVVAWYLAEMGRLGLSVSDQKIKRTALKILTDALGNEYLSDDRKEATLTKGKVIALIRKLSESGLKDSTIKRYINSGSAVVSKAWELNDWDFVNPFNGVTKGLIEEPKEREISEEEQERLLQGLSSLDRDIVLAALMSGMRIGEILQLKRNQLIVNDRGMWCKLKFKTAKIRKVAISPPLWAIFQRQPGEDLVFSDAGEPIKYHTFLKRFHKARETASVAPCTPHDLRRTFGYRARRAGVELQAIQAQLGHTSQATTERTYARVDEEKAQEAINF